MNSAEKEARALWTAKGVPQERQDELVAEITAKAQPEYLARLFPSEPTAVGEQLLIPGCEARRCAPGRAAPSLTLWDAANREGSE